MRIPGLFLWIQHEGPLFLFGLWVLVQMCILGCNRRDPSPPMRPPVPPCGDENMFGATVQLVVYPLVWCGVVAGCWLRTDTARLPTFWSNHSASRR